MAEPAFLGLLASYKRALPARKADPTWAPLMPRDRLWDAPYRPRSAPLARPPPEPSKPVKRRPLPEVERIEPDPREDA